MAAANRRLVRRLVLLTVGMFAFGFLLIPFYDVLCKITGLNGKTGGRVEVVEAVKVDESRTVTVEFVASLNIGAPWEFAPKVARMQVHPGQFYQTHFWAKNLADQPMTGQAIPSVSPGLAASHFKRSNAFVSIASSFRPTKARKCRLRSASIRSLPADVRTVTLSYTFFRIDNAGS
jgi:cytochrome c oxidase assembly protein subunit 11